LSAAPSADRATDAHDLPRLEKYELLEEIGHGGMATVYRGRDRRLGREVAVKVIHRHLRDNAEVATRFIAEARAAASLKHRGIVEVYDVSAEDDREKYLVAELVRGVTLRRLLSQHRDMPAEIGAAIVLEVCDAIQHAHESGIVHRDVKPENVLVELPCHRDEGASSPGALAADAPPGLRSVSDEESTDGDGARAAPPAASSRRDGGVIVKITDFGIAKVLDAQGVTSTGQVLGSPAHMAPEQIEGGEIDVRTDVFAIGVLLYEALVGHLPFEGKNPAQVLRRVLEGEYAPVDVERPEVGTRWANVVRGALALTPAERTPSPAVLAEQIRDELRAVGIRDPHAEIAAYFDDPEPYRDRHRARLVQRLLTRGEKARKKGDVPGAAADLNRALALAPQDPDIQRRVLELSRGRGRRAAARKVALIGAGSLVLGVAAFALARLARTDTPLPAPPADAAPATTAPPAEPDEPVDDGATAGDEPLEDGPEVDDRPRLPARPRTRPPRPPLRVKIKPIDAPRAVRFSGAPAGARVVVAGVPYVWNSVVDLAPGPVSVQVSSAPGDNCCEETRQTVRVPPAPKGEEDVPVLIPLAVTYRDARVTLSGAPSDGRLVCGGLGFTLAAGGTASVKMTQLVVSETCSAIASSGSATKTVSLTAGRSHVVPWP
jgi:serine/threonine-protein kinase